MNQFNLRVYGFILNEDQELLLSDEYRFDTFFTKLPGGGVEFGEGILDALSREFKEELNSEIISSELIFLNEFFQESVFHKNVQVTCFYYLVKCSNIDSFGKKDYTIPFNTNGEKQRWMKIQEIDEDQLSFKTDQLALKKLKKLLKI
ncbi:MAG: NUDIX hydrolase [Flavobacteriales bacterium]|nr:MAG: NUDIX hydrolase [Flavobacteriales bacterium]